MIIHPKIRSFICTTAHPIGCAQHVQEQIDVVKSQPVIRNGPKKALIIGASTGYGLSSRIVSAFGSKAATIGVFFEKPSEGKRTATAGWYNSVAFDKKAKIEGLYSRNFNGDAFSDEVKQNVIDTIKAELGGVDLVIYSLAAPRRIHPKTGKISKSVLKPIGSSYTGKSLDVSTQEVLEVTLPAATQEEVEQTIAVMGGEDWEMWVDALDNDGLLLPGANTIAYSYIGPDITREIYRKGTIGMAKDHLEATAVKLDERLKKKNGRAFVSVNKALVTQSSSVIPFIPLYFVLLMKKMKQEGVHEACIDQIYRLFSERLYPDNSRKDIPVDDKGRIRIDDLEMREDIQNEVRKLWSKVDTGNIEGIADLDGYQVDFLKLFGFGFDNVDYDAEVDP